METEVKLTKLATCAGCGAKVGAGTLVHMLEGFRTHQDPRLIVGYDKSDDASVYVLDDETALVQTTDFFPPIVDDPYLFGQIAAANAISDVYAMGGAPKLAMNLLCFPSCLGLDAVRAILAGGADKVREAGAVIAGGHSIEDQEPKYGLCVTGFGRPDRILANSTAREGDVLVLTKPIGTGVLTTAAKAQLLGEADLAAMTAIMTALNKTACETMLPLSPSACTDITGFGLVGHTLEMARGSGLTARLWAGEVPLLPGALDLAREGLLPAGCHRNRADTGDEVALAGGISRERADLLFDPQTSGGLLVALPEGGAEELLRRLWDRGLTAAVIGRMAAKGEKSVVIQS